MPGRAACAVLPRLPLSRDAGPGWRLGSGLGWWRVVISLRHLQPFLYKLIKENTGKKPARMGVTSFVLRGRGKVGSREGWGCSDHGSEHHSLLGCTAPLAPVQSMRVQGVLRACTGRCKCAWCCGCAWGCTYAWDAAVRRVLRVCVSTVGVRGAVMAMVLWAYASIAGVHSASGVHGAKGVRGAVHMSSSRGGLCGPCCRDPTSRAVSPDQAHQGLWAHGSTLGWRELRGDPEILGSEGHGSCEAISKIPPLPGERGISV